MKINTIGFKRHKQVGKQFSLERILPYRAEKNNSSFCSCMHDKEKCSRILLVEFRDNENFKIIFHKLTKNTKKITMVKVKETKSLKVTSNKNYIFIMLNLKYNSKIESREKKQTITDYILADANKRKLWSYKRLGNRDSNMVNRITHQTILIHNTDTSMIAATASS